MVVLELCEDSTLWGGDWAASEEPSATVYRYAQFSGTSYEDGRLLLRLQKIESRCHAGRDVEVTHGVAWTSKKSGGGTTKASVNVRLRPHQFSTE
jgi:hypothetical protein